MTDISTALALETAETWETMAKMEQAAQTASAAKVILTRQAKHAVEHDQHAVTVNAKWLLEFLSVPHRGETLRECADVLRILATRLECPDCPHNPPMRFCEYRPDHVAVCPIGLPCMTFAEAQEHRRNR